MSHNFIPVAMPIFNGNEKKYVDECIDSTWVSSSGKFIPMFENSFAEFCGVNHGLSCSNGTVALHLALLAFDIQPGDEVIVPTFTYVATANCVAYCGAKPVFVDCESDTWNIDPTKIEESITPKTKGIIVVHIYGHPVDMDPILEIAKKRGLFVIEDAAEAHGAEYKGKKVGSFGDISTFSFFGNKIITTGEGGMITTNNDDLAKKMRQLKGQGVDPTQRYWFPMIGYNYRMTNIEAAVGLAQLENIQWHMSQRRRIANFYKNYFSNYSKIVVQPEKPYAKNSYWMTSILLSEDLLDRDTVIRNMLENSIETRPFFYPMHVLPMYKNSNDSKRYPIADKISSRGLNLPSSGNLNDDDLLYICETLVKIVEL